MTTLEQVKEFHIATGLPVNSKPRLMDAALSILRMRLLYEELNELERDLYITKDPTAVLDDLTDIQYVLDGAYLSLGFHTMKTAAFELVHQANMRKLWPDGTVKRREDGKILKPDGWKAPNLSVLFK